MNKEIITNIKTAIGLLGIKEPPLISIKDILNETLRQFENKKEQSIVDKLAQRYFEITGQSPKFSFWSWLDSMSIVYSEEGLQAVSDDKGIWAELKEEYEDEKTS